MSDVSLTRFARRGVVVGLALPLSAALAQASRAASLIIPFTTDPIVAARVNVPVRIDGKLDEPIWRAVKPATRFFQREPVDGAPATMATDVRMIISDDAVIIGARLDDDFGALFGALESARGGGRASAGVLDDYFEVQIDPHREHLTALTLAVAPGGARRSWIVARDGTRDESWSVHWDAATRMDAKGWSVEIRIPLSEFHVAPGAEQWGVQFVRFSWRRQETDVFKYAAGEQP